MSIQIKELFMKQVVRIVSWIYRGSYLMYSKLVLKKSCNNEYEDLAPVVDIESVDKEKIYTKALDYSIQNNHIENIAIVGPYGSGKSSLIQSYVRHIGLSNKQCLTISLSTFTDKNDYYKENVNLEVNEGDNPKLKCSKPINELEASILEQILYSNEEESHKYSRLKRINVPKKRKAFRSFIMVIIFLISVGCLVSQELNNLVVSLIYKIVSNFDMNFKGISNIESHVLKSLILAVLVSNNIIVLFDIYRKMTTFSKLTLTFSKVNLEIKSSNGESLLDKYMDEIYNFFKHNNYKIVVFEDLDRYQNIDIFERLKRMNRLVNGVNSNNKIKFIYTVGDHMFDNINYKERTKFFDFVLPIIPVIDSTNSISDLKKSFDRFNMTYPISEQLMKDVSYYIDDMRTLKNIANEFITFYKILSDSEDRHFSNKLFAIICYKNRYPLDFASLSNDSGLLYDIKIKCDSLREETLDIIESEIREIEEKINTFSSEKAKSIKELDSIYKVFIAKLIPNNNMEIFDKRNIVVRRYSKENLLGLNDLETDFFGYPRYRTVGNANKDYTENELLTMNNTSEDYYLRRERVLLHDEDRFNELSRQLANMRKKRDDVKYASISTILKENSENVEVVKFQKTYPMLFYFFVNSYIEKDYHRYKGHFKEGHMTTDDTKFLALIKSRQSIELDFNISTPKLVIESLVTADFLNESTLNYGLMSYLHDVNDERFERIIQKHGNKNRFIIGYIDGVNEWNKLEGRDESFVEHLMLIVYLQNESIGKFINSGKKSLTQYQNNLNYFVGFNLRNTIKNNNNSNNSYLYDYFLKHEDINKILPYVDQESLKEILGDLSKDNRKIRRLVFKKKYLSFFEYLYERQLYEFNLNNILVFIDMRIGITYENIDVNDFFDHIKGTQLTKLLDMISDNRMEFFEMINKFENSETLNEFHICYIISDICDSVEETVKLFDNLDDNLFITDITSVSDYYWDAMLEKKRIYPSYENVLSYIEIHKINDVVINYFAEVIDELEPLDDKVNMSKNNELYRLINYVDDESTLEKIKYASSNFQVDIRKLDNIKKIKQVITLDYSVDFSEELVEEALKDDELMKLLVIKYTYSILNHPTKILINSNIMKNIYKKINYNSFVQLLNMQRTIQEQSSDYLVDILSEVSNNHFVDYMENLEDMSLKYYALSKYLISNVIGREFMISIMPKVDKLFNGFKTNNHFSIQPNDESEHLLKLLKEQGLISFKETSTGKHEIRVYKVKRSV